MTRISRSELALLGLSALLAIVAFQRTRARRLAPRVATPVVLSVAQMPAPLDTASLDDAESEIIESDPFRLSNTPSQVRYQALALPAPPPTSPRPTLVLRGIVGGPPWSAVLDGLPGQPNNTVVGEGAVYGALRIRKISRDEVVVLASDTALHLSLKGAP
jgi:hypothetical protein